jgi:hypothetical protein
MQAQMTKRKRNEAIVSTYALNEQVRELEQEVAKCRETGANEEMATDLASVADSLAYELRDRILALVGQNLGPQQQKNLMLVLRKTGEWLDEERKQLERPLQHFSGLRVVSREAARKLRDLDHFEKFLRVLARDGLMADFNFRQRMAG